jgi:L-lactate dehydrogenase complex protein LldE
MMKHHYPKLFAGRPRRRRAPIRRAGFRVVRVRRQSAGYPKLEDRGEPVTVTWHSSCHALREMDVIPYSKALIRQLKNVTLVELERETECCGFGGTFAVKQPAISAAMVKDKVADIEQTGAATLVGRGLRLPDEHHRAHGPRRFDGRRPTPGQFHVGQNHGQ